MTVLWSLRLGGYLYQRVMGHHPVEDGRYFRVTGIPATEAQALKSRGQEYREYQRTTSAFVPWFRRP